MGGFSNGTNQGKGSLSRIPGNSLLYERCRHLFPPLEAVRGCAVFAHRRLAEKEGHHGEDSYGAYGGNMALGHFRLNVFDLPEDLQDPQEAQDPRDPASLDNL